MERNVLRQTDYVEEGGDEFVPCAGAVGAGKLPRELSLPRDLLGEADVGEHEQGVVVGQPRGGAAAPCEEFRLIVVRVGPLGAVVCDVGG